MYYHSTDLKYVEYGKINPHRRNVNNSDGMDDFFNNCYDWLGHHCGYSPQIWLSISDIYMTGFKSAKYSVKYDEKKGRTKAKFYNTDDVLFGFDIIKGFPIRFEIWEYIMGAVGDISDFNKQNDRIVSFFNDMDKFYQEIEEEGEICDSPEVIAWRKNNKDLDALLKNYVFVESNQVVVPSLNLKSAKKIICRNEKQKKKLRKLGFIEDRIIIKNIKRFV